MKGKKRVTATTWTDPDDAPELNDEFFERADEYDGQKLIKRGRPPSTSTKISTTIRFDAEIVAAFRADGPGWQSRMNDALREWLSQRRAN
ncbi:MAG: BrnA antitoxin family protein [Burkholderiales bacterium]|nr:BrnA antitoxin family protein [Burkholderiales bacterium]